MTLQEILNAHKGYIDRTYNDWRRTRWLGSVLANVFRGKDDKAVKPSDLFPIPGDEDSPLNFDDERKEIEEYRQFIKDGK